jgi:predicted transcriptional regulator
MVLKKVKRELEIVLRHIGIMKQVRDNQPIGIFKLAERVKLPKHKVRYSLRVLEQSGIIEPTQHGAVIRKDADLSKLREDLEDIKELVKRIEKELEEL